MLRQAVSILLAISLVVLTSGAKSSAQTTITIGETATLGYADNGNGNLLCAQNAYLAQTATIKSLSFYVVSASMQLRLGIFDATGSGGGPGKLKAQTQAFTTSSGKWNTAAVITPVTLAPATYWLAYLPQSSNLSFRKGYTTGVSARYYNYTFASLPATFYTNPISDTAHWSFYATLTTVPTTPTTATPTLRLSFNPPNPSISATAPAGTVVTTITAAWSNGSAFTGSIALANSDNGAFALSGKNLITTGAGLTADGGTVQNVTITATQ